MRGVKHHIARRYVANGNVRRPLGYRELRVMSLKWMEDAEMFLTKATGCVIMDLLVIRRAVLAENYENRHSET